MDPLKILLQDKSNKTEKWKKGGWRIFFKASERHCLKMHIFLVLWTLKSMMISSMLFLSGGKRNSQAACQWMHWSGPGRGQAEKTIIWQRKMICHYISDSFLLGPVIQVIAHVGKAKWILYFICEIGARGGRLQFENVCVQGRKGQRKRRKESTSCDWDWQNAACPVDLSAPCSIASGEKESVLYVPKQKFLCASLGCLPAWATLNI
jgi:hypothetical protein